VRTLAPTQAGCANHPPDKPGAIVCASVATEVLIDQIHRARQNCCGIIINPGAYTHTSIAIADALKAVNLPVVEIHLTNIYRREHFRCHSYMSTVADIVLVGAGAAGYAFAVHHLDLAKVNGAIESVESSPPPTRSH
jgi:3-dehydroquinate dehydratase